MIKTSGIRRVTRIADSINRKNVSFVQKEMPEKLLALSKGKTPTQGQVKKVWAGQMEKLKPLTEAVTTAGMKYQRRLDKMPKLSSAHVAFLDELDKIASKNARKRLDDLSSRLANGDPVGLSGDRRTYVEARASARSAGQMAGQWPTRPGSKTSKSLVELGRDMKTEAKGFLDYSSKTMKIPSAGVRPPPKPLAPMAKVLKFTKKASSNVRAMRAAAAVSPAPMFASQRSYLEGRVGAQVAGRLAGTNTRMQGIGRKLKAQSAQDLDRFQQTMKLAHTSTGAMQKEAFLRDLNIMSSLKNAMGSAVGAAQKLPGQMMDAARAAPGAAASFARSVPGRMEGAANNLGNAVGSFARPVDAMRQGWNQTTHDTKNMHWAAKALMAHGLVTGLKDVALRDDPSGMGRSRLHRGLRFAGDQAGTIMTAPYGFTGAVAGSLIGSKLGDIAGRSIDKARRYVPYKKQQQESPAFQMSNVTPEENA